MSREIKFRVWTGTEMITPPNDTIGCGSGAEIIEISLSGFVSKRNAYGLDVFGKNPSFDEPDKDIVLMQFTGFTDKNKTKIYEGDILNFGNNNNVPVIFENGSFCVFDEPLGWDFDTEKQPVKTDFNYCLVVGNIHESPELLNKPI